MHRCHLVTLSFADRRPFVGDEPARLYLARAVSEVGATHGLVGWRVRHRRLKVVFAADRAGAGEAARRLAIGIGQVLGAGRRLRPARVEEVGGARIRDLLVALIGDGCPARTTASSLPDACGLRALAPFLRGVGPEAPLPPFHREAVEDVADWTRLAESAAAVFGYGDLRRRYAWRARALSAAAAVAFPELGPSELARRLEVSRSTIHRALERTPSEELRAMVEGQLRWRSVRTDAR